MSGTVPGMRYEYIAGFGPIGSADTMYGFWAKALGIPFDEVAPSYWHAHGLSGAKVFGLWPLEQAAEATFGTPIWPADRAVPQAWLELEVPRPEDVEPTVEELRAQGQEIVTEAHTEPWGQITARLISPEGILVGISYLPDFHEEGPVPAESSRS